jgi:glutathionyl-hydroquinone reductase
MKHPILALRTCGQFGFFGLLVVSVSVHYSRAESLTCFYFTATVFRSWIKKDSEFPPEANRYHIYVSFACPWAHRTLVVRKLKGLEDVISFSTVHYHLGDGGWHFDAEYPDPLHPQNTFLKQVYLATDPEYAGRITVPVLFDKKVRHTRSETSKWH